MAKWKIESDNAHPIIIKCDLTRNNLFDVLREIFKHREIFSFAPTQLENETSDFTILFQDGKTLTAKLINEERILSKEEMLQKYTKEYDEKYCIDFATHTTQFGIRARYKGMDFLAYGKKDWSLEKQQFFVKNIIDFWENNPMIEMMTNGIGEKLFKRVLDKFVSDPSTRTFPGAE